MCCGQKRTNASAATRGTRATTENGPDWSAPPTIPQREMTDWRAMSAAVPVRYLEAVPITVQGRATGHQYVFSAADPVQVVDRRDAESLLRSRYFRRDA